MLTHDDRFVAYGRTYNSFIRRSHTPVTHPDPIPDLPAGSDWMDSIDRLWLPEITLVLIMVSGENLLETGVRLKTAKTKKQSDQPIEYWSPNFGDVFSKRKPKMATQDGTNERTGEKVTSGHNLMGRNCRCAKSSRSSLTAPAIGTRKALHEGKRQTDHNGFRIVDTVAHLPDEARKSGI
jgi:hypothetical protein